MAIVPPHTHPRHEHSQYADSLFAVPTGLIAPFGGTVAPPGWALCDGTAHGSAELQAVIGSANTPDLRGKFILGVSATYPDKSTGGAATHTLTAAESGLQSHTHPNSTSSGFSANHTHWIDPPYTDTGYVSHDHGHGFTTGWMNQNNVHSHATREGITTGDSEWYIDTADADPTVRYNTIVSTDVNHQHSGSTGGIGTNHYHGVDIGGFSSGTVSSDHSHTTYTPANTAVGGAAHNNMPPYYALTYIIKT